MDEAPDTLGDVSETAILTLISRIQESEKKDPFFKDPMAKVLLKGLEPHLSQDIKDRILKRKKMSRALTSYITLRADKYDSYTREFLDKHPDGIVVSLGCGFDTRYWRAVNDPKRYFELDLPEVIDLKRKALKEKITYTMISRSVMEFEWMDRISTIQNEYILFIAEGLLMYLEPEKVRELIERMSERFSKSQLAAEVVAEKYTRGMWKKMTESKMRRRAGTTAGSSFNFGINNAKDLEKFGKGIEVLEEWSYLEDRRVRPGMLRWFRNFKTFTRAQWTVKMSIE
ncbi:MAG: class I SAM-dependent methyltransferase [Thermoplasmatota archaeon]